MKVIFIDKQDFTHATVPNVKKILHKHNGKCYEWECEKVNGYTEKYKCSRFEVERIEEDEMENGGR